jgi:hypothetical protein
LKLAVYLEVNPLLKEAPEIPNLLRIVLGMGVRPKKVVDLPVPEPNQYDAEPL